MDAVISMGKTLAVSTGCRIGWPLLILGVVLCGCSRTPPSSAAHPSNTGAAPVASPPVVQAASGEVDASRRVESDTPTPEPAALSDAKSSSGGMRADAQSTSLEKDALMGALFPGWKPTRKAAGSSPPPAPESTENAPVSPAGPGHLHIDRLPPNSGYIASEDPDDLDFDPEPWGVVKLDDLHVVLVTVANAGWTAGAGSHTLVGAYFFTNRDGVWHLSKHRDVAAWGISNQGNDLEVESWPAHGFVLSLTTENGEQGANTSEVDMTLLTPDNATHLLHASLAQSDAASTASGGFEDEISCGDLESDAFKPPHGKLEARVIDCHSAGGHWSFDGDLIHFNYEGVRRKADAAGNVLPLERWQSVVTYKWENQAVKLIEGKDPEFGY